MTKRNIYNIITIIAMITMPMAASINFGDAAYDALLSRTQDWIAIAGGIATGIGFESIGVLAGHLAVTFYSRKDSRAIGAVVALAAYVGIGMYELWNIDMARFVPLLAGLVYLLAGLQYEAVEEKEKETAVSETKMSWQLEQAAKDRELKRELERQQLADKTAVQLARIEAKAKQPTTTRADVPVSSGHLPGDFRLLTAHQKEQIKNLTTGELTQMADISDSTARRWKRQVAANGYHK